MFKISHNGGILNWSQDDVYYSVPLLNVEYIRKRNPSKHTSVIDIFLKNGDVWGSKFDEKTHRDKYYNALEEALEKNYLRIN